MQVAQVKNSIKRSGQTTTGARGWGVKTGSHRAAFGVFFCCRHSTARPPTNHVVSINNPYSPGANTVCPKQLNPHQRELAWLDLLIQGFHVCNHQQKQKWTTTTPSVRASPAADRLHFAHVGVVVFIKSTVIYSVRSLTECYTHMYRITV